MKMPILKSEEMAYHQNLDTLPEHMRDGMKLYIESGIEPGDFLRAVLCNDLAEACARADHVNAARMKDLVSYLYNHAPSNCWRSRERYINWVEVGGLSGMGIIK